jgi:hypothetical protein
MNVEMGTEAARFPEKEYINGIFVAVCEGCFYFRIILIKLGRLRFQLYPYHFCPKYERSSLLRWSQMIDCLTGLRPSKINWRRLVCTVHVCPARVTVYLMSEQELARKTFALPGLRPTPTHCLNKSFPGKCLSCQGYGLPTVWTRACQTNVCLVRVTAYPLFDQELARQMYVLPG